MNCFISGGCKNGKTMYAQRLARDAAERMGVPLYYVATMRPRDEEDIARIAKHRKEREGWDFLTLERSEYICSLTEEADVDTNGVFLVDSVTALMAEAMFQSGGDLSKEALESRAEKATADMEGFAERTGNAVFISDFIYSDAALYDEGTELYRRALAAADRRLAELCDMVLEICCGTATVHKAPPAGNDVPAGGKMR